MDMLSITHITGGILFYSRLQILEASKIIGDEIFGGAAFSGLEKSYFEEIPGVIIPNGVLGLQVSIQENEYCEETAMFTYCLGSGPIRSLGINSPVVHGNLNLYLLFLFKQRFEGNQNVFMSKSG
jgi:hypothetical protein